MKHRVGLILTSILVSYLLHGQAVQPPSTLLWLTAYSWHVRVPISLHSLLLISATQDGFWMNLGQSPSLEEIEQNYYNYSHRSMVELQGTLFEQVDEKYLALRSDYVEVLRLFLFLFE